MGRLRTHVEVETGSAKCCRLVSSSSRFQSCYSCSHRTVQLPANSHSTDELRQRLPGLFTGMPPRKTGKLDGAASPDPGGDRISALPNDALHHVLSFLPAEDAVRTCVLARRWRHLWKSATGLRIWFGHGNEPPSVQKFREFVIYLLLLRNRDSSLHTCDIRFRPSHRLPEDKFCLNLWIRHIVDCEVRILRLEIQVSSFRFELPLPLVSEHLTTLALVGVVLADNVCNFSNCPNLENIEFAECEFYSVQEISSKSLKHLSFSHYCYFNIASDRHTLICMPSLVSLRLDMHFCSLPVLDRMPSLKEAFLRNQSDNCYTCDEYDDELAYEYDNPYNICIFLQGLSEAENLTLMSDFNGAFFRRDLKWCPTFNNLRTLLLSEWCVDPDFKGLKCILKHSPVLEKLTLQLFTKGSQHKLEMIGRYNQMERSATISKHLKEIRVKCEVVNKKVYKVLKFLGTFGIHFLFK